MKRRWSWRGRGEREEGEEGDEVWEEEGLRKEVMEAERAVERVEGVRGEGKERQEKRGRVVGWLRTAE